MLGISARIKSGIAASSIGSLMAKHILEPHILPHWWHTQLPMPSTGRRCILSSTHVLVLVVYPPQKFIQSTQYYGLSHQPMGRNVKKNITSPLRLCICALYVCQTQILLIKKISAAGRHFWQGFVNFRASDNENSRIYLYDKITI